MLGMVLPWAPDGWAKPLAIEEPVRGWIILSDSDADADAVIEKASDYDINHLQLSHHIVHDLREIKEKARQKQVNRLTDLAHRSGIQEVVVWDHALYDLEYYPERFRDGPGGTIDLDNPDFWAWFKEDYRKMLDGVPRIDGLILTFVETGARAENQYSRRLNTNQEKLAAVVNAVADVVIGERGLNLYARTFAYSDEEYANIVGAVERFKYPEIRLMMKETPHDFFLTHPNDRFAGSIDRPTIIEFDTTGEFNGQGIIANTWPGYVLGRWRAFADRSNVMGYTARIDRYGNTRLIDRPGEINLLALKRGMEDPQVTAEEIYDAFIGERYGLRALPEVKAAFKLAFDIVTSSLYTLGTNTANHSQLGYDPYASSYARHVSGKWLNPPIAYVGHGVNREVHYWKDVINRLAPAFAKSPGFSQWEELPHVVDQGWAQPGERMTEEWLRLVATEKKHGVALAEEALNLIDSAWQDLDPEDYQDLRHYFARTLLTTRLHGAVATAYFGFRVYCRGESFRSGYVLETTERGLREASEVAELIRSYPVMPPVGQWNWAEDAEAADEYVRLITEEGWPATTRDFPNPNAGMTFPYPLSGAGK